MSAVKHLLDTRVLLLAFWFFPFFVGLFGFAAAALQTYLIRRCPFVRINNVGQGSILIRIIRPNNDAINWYFRMKEISDTAMKIITLIYLNTTAPPSSSSSLSLQATSITLYFSSIMFKPCLTLSLMLARRFSGIKSWVFAFLWKIRKIYFIWIY